MAKLNKDNKEKLDLLNATEVNSLKYEGVVSINGKEVWQRMRKIDELDTNEKVKELWDEMVFDEGLFNVE